MYLYKYTCVLYVVSPMVFSTDFLRHGHVPSVCGI